MNKKTLKRYLRRNDRYTFMVDEYRFPKFLISTKNKKIDLEDNRNQNLHQSSTWSPNSKNFLDTKHKSVRYIREFPIIIRDRKLWELLCIKYQLGEDKLSRNYFLIDYFMPDFNLLVEIDSQLHEIDYDKARDDYIRLKYGLETIRFYEYGRYSYQTFEDNFQFLKCYCRNHGSIPIKFNYLGLTMRNYVIINHRILPIINKIERYLLYNKRAVLALDNYIISKSDLYYLSNKLDKFYEVCSYIKYQYNVDVIIAPSNPYM